MQLEDIQDLVTTTQKELGRNKLTDLSFDNQEFFALPQLMTEEKVMESDGYAIQFSAMMGTSGNAKFVGFGTVDQYNIKNQMKTGTVAWKRATTNMAYDKTEFTTNSGASRIFNLIKVRRQDMFTDLAKLFEQAVWNRCPASSVEQFLGVDNWIIPSNTPGFVTTVPSGYTDIGGIDPAVYPRWANYSGGQYVNMTEDDLVFKMRDSMDHTYFKAPVKGLPNYDRGAMKRGMYTVLEVRQTLEGLARLNNENLGSDLAKYDGEVVLRKIALDWVPELDKATHIGYGKKPVYGIDWSQMYFEFLEGWFMQEGEVEQSPLQHTMVKQDVDTVGNMIARNRRGLWITALNTF